MDAVQRAVLVPSAEIVVHRAARRQVLRQGRPLAAGADNIHAPIDHIPLVDRPFVAARLRSRDQWLNERPLLVRQVTRVAQLAPVILTAVLLRPHLTAPANRPAAMESHVIPTTQDVSGWTLRFVAVEVSGVNPRGDAEPLGGAEITQHLFAGYVALVKARVELVVAKFQDGAKHCLCGRGVMNPGLRIRGSRASWCRRSLSV